MMVPAGSNEALYGPRRSASVRFPSARNPDELWNQIVAAYPQQIMWRKFFDEEGKELMDGHAMNPRNIGSAQRKYELRVLIEGYDSDGRGLLQGVEGTSGPDSTALLGGKQLCKAIYRAIKNAPDNANVQKVLSTGYKVNMWPKNLPEDICLESKTHSNKIIRG